MALASEPAFSDTELNQVVTAAANEAASVESAIRIALDQVCAQTGWPVGHAYMLAGEELVTAGVWHLEDSERFETFRRHSDAAWVEKRSQQRVRRPCGDGGCPSKRSCGSSSE